MLFHSIALIALIERFSCYVYIRQLLSGVDNLRLMALTLENMNREIPNKDDEFLSDSDEHDFTGPAL